MNLPSASRNNTIAWIIGGAWGLYLYTWLTAVPQRWQATGLSFGFQVLCWSGALIVASKRSSHGQVRISNPIVIVMFWCAMYFIIPSVIWLQNAPMALSEHITLEIAGYLFWLHGLFMAAFAIGFLLIRSQPNPVLGINPERLPSGRILFSIPFVFLIGAVLVRLYNGGGLLPNETRGTLAMTNYANIQEARGTGGLNYLFVQLSGKISIFLYLLQGIGVGLILSKYNENRRNQRRALMLIIAGVTIMILFGNGERLPPIMMFLGGIILFDLLARPIPWRYFIVALVAGTIVLDIWGYFRANRDLPILEALNQSLTEYNSPTAYHLNEFTVMLGKEAVFIQYWQENHQMEGLSYLFRNLLMPFPSQIVPSKIAWEKQKTADILAKQLLTDTEYQSGAGVGGTIIGDSYRIAGTLGIPLLGLLLGFTIALGQVWAMGSTNTNLLKLGLWATFLGATNVMIREEFGSFTAAIAYRLVIPWIGFSLFLVITKSVMWFVPLGSLTQTDSTRRTSSVGETR